MGNVQISVKEMALLFTFPKGQTKSHFGLESNSHMILFDGRKDAQKIFHAMCRKAKYTVYFRIFIRSIEPICRLQ
jgi:hypothetical protein